MTYIIMCFVSYTCVHVRVSNAVTVLLLHVHVHVHCSFKENSYRVK